MITRKNNTLSIFLGFIAFIFLISLACNVPIKNEPDDALPEAPLASQEVNTGPNRAPTVPPKLEVSKPEPEAEPEPEPEADPVSPQVLNAVPAVLGKTGFGQKQQEVGYGFELTNNNVDVAIRSIPFQIAVYDSNNKVVDTEGGYTDYIYSGETLGVGGTIYLDEGVKAGKIEVQVSEGEPIVAEFTEPFIVDNVVYVPSEYYSSVRGVITNPYDQDITSVKVSAILYDEADNIVGGGNTYLSFLLANSSAGVIVPVSGSDNVSRVELYPSITNIYEYENPNPIP